MENTTTTKAAEDKSGDWILNLFGLLFFLALAWWSYTTITKLEASGGTLRLPKILMMFYETMGKWGEVGVWLAGAAYNLIRGIISFVKYR